MSTKTYDIVEVLKTSSGLADGEVVKSKHSRRAARD